MTSKTSMTSPASEPIEPPSAAADLLCAHVPLTLLIDLVTTVDSHDIYAAEPGDADWLPAAVGAVAE
jgi:hypothetical protein